jgi:hypothetical protein
MDTSKFYEFDLGVSARINEIIEDTKDMAPNWMSYGIFDKVTPDSMIYRTKGVTGLGRTKKFAEGSTIIYDETYPQYQTEYPMQQFGLGVTISQLLMKTRPSELETKLDEVRQLRIAANESIEKNAWQIFVDAFVTTDSDSDSPTFRLDDAVSLISASHPSRVAGVAVRSNKVVSAGVTNPTLGETALFEAQRKIAEQLNGRGLPMNYNGGYLLLVPKALEKTAVEITKSTKRSGTANNDLNYFEGTMDVVSTTYIGAANGGSDTAWFLIAKDAPVKSLKYASLIDPKIEKDTDFDTKTIKVSVDGAYAFGYSCWEYVVGSTGLLS